MSGCLPKHWCKGETQCRRLYFAFFSCEHPQNNINTMQHKVVSYRTPMCNVLLNNYRARLLKTKCFYSWLQTIANMSCSNLLTWGSCKELLGCITHNDILSMLRVVGLALSASRVMLQNRCCGLKKTTRAVVINCYMLDQIFWCGISLWVPHKEAWTLTKWLKNTVGADGSRETHYSLGN